MLWGSILIFLGLSLWINCLILSESTREISMPFIKRLISLSSISKRKIKGSSTLCFCLSNFLISVSYTSNCHKLQSRQTFLMKSCSKEQHSPIAWPKPPRPSMRSNFLSASLLKCFVIIRISIQAWSSGSMSISEESGSLWGRNLQTCSTLLWERITIFLMDMLSSIPLKNWNSSTLTTIPTQENAKDQNRSLECHILLSPKMLKFPWIIQQIRLIRVRQSKKFLKN